MGCVPEGCRRCQPACGCPNGFDFVVHRLNTTTIEGKFEGKEESQKLPITHFFECHPIRFVIEPRFVIEAFGRDFYTLTAQSERTSGDVWCMVGELGCACRRRQYGSKSCGI